MAPMIQDIQTGASGMLRLTCRGCCSCCAGWPAAWATAAAAPGEDMAMAGGLRNESMLVASRRSRARQQADRSLSLLVGWVVSWRSEDLRDARVATWQATLPDWQPACARVWVGLLAFQAPEGHPGGFVSAWARPGSHGGRRQRARCRRRVRRLRPESSLHQHYCTSPSRPAHRRGHRATAANEQRSSAPRTSSSVLTGSGALVARLQCKSVRHVQATHRRQARRISAARPLIRSDWNQARPPRGLRPASPSFVPRPRTGCTPLHLVRAADGAARFFF